MAPNEMAENPALFEEKARAKIKKERIITGTVCAVSAVLAIVFGILRETTAKKEIVGEGTLFQYTSVEYGIGMTAAAGIFFFIAFLSLILFVCCFIFCGYSSVVTKGDLLVLVRSLSGIRFYVNGAEQTGGGYYREGRLSDGTRVTVSLSRNGRFAHVSFSDGRDGTDL